MMHSVMEIFFLPFMLDPFQTLYVAAVFILLLIRSIAHKAARLRERVALVVSAGSWLLYGLYEAAMPAYVNIRIDMFIIAPVLYGFTIAGVVAGLAGFRRGGVSRAKGGSRSAEGLGRSQKWVVVCVGALMLAVLAFVAMQHHKIEKSLDVQVLSPDQIRFEVGELRQHDLTKLGLRSLMAWQRAVSSGRSGGFSWRSLNAEGSNTAASLEKGKIYGAEYRQDQVTIEYHELGTLWKENGEVHADFPAGTQFLYDPDRNDLAVSLPQKTRSVVSVLLKERRRLIRELVSP